MAMYGASLESRRENLEMLEKLSDLLDKLRSLPHWQVALLSLLVVGAMVAGYLVLWPAPRPVRVFHAGAEEAPAEARQVAVYVAGAVIHPGVIRLEEGKRVVDAIEAAGGPLQEADLESLNLAQTVQDGQKILIPRRGEGQGGAGSRGESGKAGGKVNINLAGPKELEELPGIGPTLAERIVAYRENKGAFKSIDELKKVSGIGEKKFEEIRDLIEV
jgi:competence protein ComEA